MRYKRFEIVKRKNVAVPAIKLYMADSSEINYFKVIYTKSQNAQTAVTNFQRGEFVMGYIREDHPLFNFDLIKAEHAFRMRNHSAIIKLFLTEVLRKEFIKKTDIYNLK